MHNVYYGHELYHHGILKQKWGKRNGPPYPLKQSQKSSAEKKAEGGSDSGNSSNEKKEAKSSASEKAKTMTDDELRAAKNRADLEADYIKSMNKRDNAASGNYDSNNGSNNGNDNSNNNDGKKGKSYEFTENAELAKKVERLHLENKYYEEKAKLTENQKSAVRKFVENYAKTKGADLITDASKKILDKLINAFKDTTKEIEETENTNKKSNKNSNNQNQKKKKS